MSRKFLTLIVSAILSLTSTAGAQTDQSVGLVLSGGGAKGIAHIGFIQALEENEIPIDYITGTSMGAIVGSLYAMGYTPAEMIQLIKSPQFAQWSSGETPAKEVFNFVKPEPTSKWLDVNFSADSPTALTSMLPSRLINPLPMSYAFMELYSAANGACNNDFNKLMVPFRCVASDIYRHKPVVFKNGELALAVRASMSFPIVFQSIEIGDTLFVDGGLYDNYPVNVMTKDFNPDRIIGVNVGSPNTKPNVNNIYGQIEDMIMSVDTVAFPKNKGINVRFDLERFGLLSWDKTDEIYNIGYKRGVELADSIRRVISSRRPQADVEKARAEFRRKLPAVSFDSVTVSNATPSQAELITQLFGSRSGHTVDLIDARTGFYRVTSTERMRNLVPHASWHSDSQTYSLDLKADVTKDFNAAIGGYLSTSSASLIYAGIKWEPFGLYKPSVAFEGWVGGTYLAAVGRLTFLTAAKGSDPMSINKFSVELKAEADRYYETEKLVYEFTKPAFLRTSDVGARLMWERPTTLNSTFALSAGYLHNTNRFHTVDIADPNLNGQNYLIRDLGLLKAAWTYSTLDNDALPTSGAKYVISASLEGGKQRLKSWGGVPENIPEHYIRGSFSWNSASYIKLKRFSIGILTSLWYTTSKLFDNYTTSIVDARQFMPTTSCIDLFDPNFRANGWMAVGVNPVVPIGSLFQARFAGWLSVPMRRILDDGAGNAVYSKWFDTAKFAGELSLGMSLPFGPVRAWVAYRTSDYSRWSAGLSIGVLIKTARWR